MYSIEKSKVDTHIYIHTTYIQTDRQIHLHTHTHTHTHTHPVDSTPKKHTEQYIPSHISDQSYQFILLLKVCKSDCSITTLLFFAFSHHKSYLPC